MDTKVIISLILGCILFSTCLIVSYWLLDVERVGSFRISQLLDERTLNRKLNYTSAGKFVEKENLTFSTLLNVIRKWNPDTPDVPTNFKESIPIFNYSNLDERSKAEQLRNSEQIFKLRDVPCVQTVSEKWNDEYLMFQLQKGNRHAEKSSTNHFMFWKGSKLQGSTWKPPTEILRNMEFDEWLKLAKNADQAKLKNDSVHFYFHSSASARDHGQTFIARDLDFFSTTQPNFFITKPEANKGIQCRFGMRGIIAEAHYDGGRNMVAMIKGSKRYILAPPEACKYLGIITDTRHPSYRHSVIDWSDEKQAISRGFDKVPAIDTILREGEVLYIPSYWFHYIVSLQYSIQCNSRSGSPPNEQGLAEIQKCQLQRRKQKRNSNKDATENIQ